MLKVMRSWSINKAKKDSDLTAMHDRIAFRIVPPNAVLLKPKGEPAARVDKFFKDEDDFLSIESSLNSSDQEDAKETITYLRTKTKKRERRSESVRGHLIPKDKSDLFILS